MSNQKMFEDYVKSIYNAAKMFPLEEIVKEE